MKQQLKVFLMMTGLTVLMIFLGDYLGGQRGAMGFFLFAAVMNFGMYWFSDRFVLRMYRAKTVGPSEAPDLYRMVDQLRQRAELPMPVVAVSPQDQPNAFATGRGPNTAVVCFTRGILRLLPPKELEGVIAHELAHIKHRHMLVGTLAATMAGAIMMLSRVAFWFGGRGENRNPFVGIILLILGPIAAMIIQFAISRQNEFQADLTGGGIVGDPMALAGALERLDGYAREIPMEVNQAAAALAIVNPLSGRRRGIGGLFSTHPPVEERVAALREQAREISGGAPGRLTG